LNLTFLPGEAMDFGFELVFEFGVGFKRVVVVTAFAGGETGTLQAIDLGVVHAAGCMAIGRFEDGEPDLVADPADADLGADEV